MDGSFDLSAINRVAVSGFQISGAMQLNDVAFAVLDDLVTFYNVCAHQTNFTVWFHTEEFRRWYLSKVICIDVKFTGKWNFSYTSFIILWNVW